MGHWTSEELVVALATLAVNQDLRRRAFDGCREWLSEDAGAGPSGLGGWSAEEIEAHFGYCSLVFDHGLLGYPFVDTRLDLYVQDGSGMYIRGLRPVGYYRLITRLDGTPDDDYFVIESSKPARN